ncbi:MAG: thermonuclease family protein [Candidatus Methylomirabilales bacterium]
MKKGLPLLLLISVLLFPGASSAPSARLRASAALPVKVKRVIDGDTILLQNGERVRYIGINAPEVNHSPRGAEPLGREAKEANRRLVEGKRVRLEFDSERRDKYGRLLAYVFLEDGTFVNGWLVERGLAKAVSYPPNLKYQDLLKKLEQEARKKQLGVWADAPSAFDPLRRIEFAFAVAVLLAAFLLYLSLLQRGRKRPASY